MATGDAEESNLRRQLHGGIREMVSTLVHRLSHFHSTAKSGKNQHCSAIKDRSKGVTMIVGSNAGAIMRLDQHDIIDSQGMLFDDHKSFGAYANNNYQAVNDSVLVNENYTLGDPGVQMAESSYVEEHRHPKKRREKQEESLRK